MKKLIPVLVIAILLRLLVMGITFHPDLSGQLLTSYFYAYENVVNIYDHLAGLPSTHPLVKNFGVSDIFIYPPITYFTLGSFLKFSSLFIPESFFLDLMNGISIYSLPNLSLNLAILKFPYLVIDILAAFALASLFENERQKRWALLLWLFNPVTLYATFMMGVFDIIPVIFTILSLYFAKKKNLLLSAIMLSLGAAFKQYPIFLLPFVVLAGKDLRERIKITLCGLVPYILTLIPFLSSSAFKYMVFGAKSQKMFYMQWMVSGAEGIYPYVFGYLLLLWHSLKIGSLTENLWKYFLSYFLLLFSVTHFHPQWFLWGTPFLILELVENRWRSLWQVFTILACFVAIVLTFENSLSSGLFAVINPDLNQFQGIDKLVAQKTDLFFLKSTVRSILAATSLFLVLDVLKTKDSRLSV